ncbi:pimeloyl-ACP methyl ester carboxylesterase [Paraburkholderia sp. BL6669N2]|uniref:alpha/beta fold hydrolase n=1 Tax=Paraburkholderia sp. BL6669N2 TaxID=1938807 RepID=UPI000E3B019E|nr:alpha/beta hydrolase [Paraburkholderia sp. BL6669N2]REG51000.1 pimeloyl-ACP methyl ester carboxylesterase [Paraburkholderia sp. BL6669N2]
MTSHAQNGVTPNIPQDSQSTLVFIHGFLDGAAAWDDTVAALGERANDSVCVDLPGMGGRVDADGPYSLDRFADEVVDRVRTLNRPVVLVGHSMGTQVAELAASVLGSQVRALALLTPVPLHGAGLPDEVMQSFYSLAGNPTAQRELRRQESVNLDDARLEKLGRIGDRVKAESVGIFADIWNKGHPSGTEHTCYSGPVLIVRSAGDLFVNEEMIFSSVAPHFTNPTIAVVEDAGHWPHVEQPESVAAILSEFLAVVDQPVKAGVVAQGWTRAFEQKSADAFSDAFAANVVLEASVLTRPVEGAENVKTVLTIASSIYESLRFTHQATHGLRNYLEWEVQAFGGEKFSGVTVLTMDEAGNIVRAAIHHRPLGSALKFSSELSRRLVGKIDASFFYDPAH